MVNKLAQAAIEKHWLALEVAAADLGKRAGENAAAWWEQDAVGGRAPSRSRESERDALRKLLRDDEFDCPDLLSGEWADGETVASVVDGALYAVYVATRDADLREACSVDVDDGCDDLAEIYDTAARDAYRDACIKAVKSRLSCVGEREGDAQ